MSLPTKLDKVKGDYISVLDSFSEDLVKTGEVDLATHIAEAVSEGKSIRSICDALEFPKVHMMAWIRKKHPELLIAAKDIHADTTLRRIENEAECYDEANHKHLQAKHKVQMEAMKIDRSRVIEEADVDSMRGMNFSINVVMPDYVQPQAQAQPEIVIVDDDEIAEGEFTEKDE